MDGGSLASGQRGSTKSRATPPSSCGTSPSAATYQLLGLSMSVQNLCFSADARFLAAGGKRAHGVGHADGEVAVCKNCQAVTSITWGPIDTSGEPVVLADHACNAQVFRNVLEYKIQTMAYGMSSSGLPASWPQGMRLQRAVVRYDEQSRPPASSPEPPCQTCACSTSTSACTASVGVSTRDPPSRPPRYIIMGLGSGGKSCVV